MPHVFQGGQLFSQEMLDLNTEIAERYPNLRLGWIPPEERGEDDTMHWSINQVDHSGNIIAIIKRMTSFECVPSLVLKWLWDNDGQRIDPWEKFQAEQQRLANERRARDKEDIYERAEVLNSIAKSGLHTYRINGRKIGADNEMPSLGLDEHVD